MDPRVRVVFACVLLSVTCPAAGADEQASLIEQLLAKQAKMEQEQVELQVRLAHMENQMRTRRLEIPSGPVATAVLEAIGNITDVPIREALTSLLNSFGEVSLCLDYVWLLLCGALVMFMQSGFAILESGACRSMNANTLLMKNVFDACASAVVWYVLGYGLAYGESGNGFIGTQSFAGTGFSSDETHAHRDWFFQWAFCATAATIVSGAIAERTKFIGYMVFAIVMTGLIYPVVVHWTWHADGWLVQKGYSDFAGSGIVHLTGGVAACAGSVIVGPRAGRWKTQNALAFAPHNMALVVLGTFILWFGWYGFNCGSTLAFSDSATARSAALVAMNTTLAAAAGGLTMLIVRLRSRVIDLAGMCNGILVGLVAVCAGVNDMAPGFALLTGVLGALVHEVAHVLMLKLKIDDPLDAFAVHGGGGLLGVLVRPLFSLGGADWELFGTHCLAVLCIAAWSGGLSVAVFLPLRLAGQLTSSIESQLRGSDAKMAQSAYGDATPAVILDEADSTGDDSE